MVNYALKQAVQRIRSQYINRNGPYYFTPSIGVYLDWDTSTNRAVLNVDKAFADNNKQSLEIYFSERLYELFVGFPAYSTMLGDSKMYRLRLEDFGVNTTSINSAPVLQMYQEVCSTALWNPVSSIVFATSLLPIIPTQTGRVVELGSGNLISGGNNSNICSIISDFSVSVDANNEYRPHILYNPGAEYRLVDMNSCMNLNRLDIQVFWKDVNGNIYPLKLLPGCSAHVKLMFRQKEFSNIS